ncbi:unnamed protein product [Lampetra planeri]
MESAGILLAGGDEERDSCGSRWTELDCRRAPPAPRRTDAAAPPGRYPIIGRRRGSPPKLKSPERESGRVATRGHQTMQGGHLNPARLPLRKLFNELLHQKCRSERRINTPLAPICWAIGRPRLIATPRGNDGERPPVPGLAVRPARKKPSRHQIQAFLLCAPAGNGALGPGALRLSAARPRFFSHNRKKERHGGGGGETEEALARDGGAENFI